MPEIHPSKIISYSSEDKAFPAQNLLKASSFSKWRSEKGGAKQEVVELGFDQPVEVCRLDIGNNGSAFIEVLVRRSVSTENSVVLLPSSSFLSPTEAKNETNLTRVRVFSGNELQSTAVSQKWDIFRIVCSQPFNKNLPYGVSFISFYSPSSKIEADYPENSSSLIDFEEEIEDSTDLQPGALFRASKAVTRTTEVEVDTRRSMSVAEKLLLTKRLSEQSPSTSHASSGSPVCIPASHRTSILPAQSRTPAALNEDSQGNTPSGAPKVVLHDSDVPASIISHSSSTTSSVHLREHSTSATSLRPLDGVIFTLSGYQNPLRSDLRRKALELGARFRPDWNSDCTHLVCAFANTPKFKEVIGKGIIVSARWIEECHRTRSKVNWRPYRVGRAPSPSASSDAPRTYVSRVEYNGDEDEEEENGSPHPACPSSLKRRRKASVNEDDDDEWRPSGSSEDEEETEEEEEEYEQESASTPEHATDDSEGHSNRKKRTVTKRPKKESKSKKIRKSVPSTDKPVNPEDEDTDDEIERAMNSLPADVITNAGQLGDQDTVTSRLNLPDIFTCKHFFIHNKAIPVDEERYIRRLIIAFNGTLHQYMSEDVQYAVTRSAWNDEFDEALTHNPSLIFVRPDWIFACDQEAKWVPFQKFLVVG